MEPIDISSTDSESSDWDLEKYKAYNKNDPSIKDSATSVPNIRVLPSSFASSSGTSNAGSSQRAISAKRKAPMNGHSSHFNQDSDYQLQIVSSPGSSELWRFRCGDLKNSSDSEWSDWDLEKYKAYCMDTATSYPISASSLGTSSSGLHGSSLRSFLPKRKAPMEDVMKDNHHGSRVVFPSVKPPMSILTEQHGGTFFDICHPSGVFNEQAVSDVRLVDEAALPDFNQPVTEANLPEGLISALLGLKNPPFVTPVEKKKSSFQTEAVRQLTGSLTKVEGLRFAIVVARFNEIVSKPLLEGALDTFKKYSVREEDIVVVWVPGSFEIGLVAEKLGKSGKYHAILCIGAVVRGDTTDYDVVANSAASGVLSAGLNSGVPCIFGVLTCEDMDKALSHAGGRAGNKGSEAALTAIEMASLFEHHLKE